MTLARRPKTRGDLRPREGVWFAKPRPIRKTSKAVPWWWLVPALPAVVAGQIDGSMSFHGANLVMVGVGLAALLRIALEVTWQIGEARALRATRQDRAFSDAPPGIVEYPVEIVLFDAGVHVGADRGFVWFEDGLLTFNGAACSFVLAADDIAPRKRGDGKDFYASLPNDALRLKTFGRAAYVRFLPLRGKKGLLFSFALGTFLASRLTSDRTRQWPPLIPYDAAPNVAEPGARPALG